MSDSTLLARLVAVLPPMRPRSAPQRLLRLPRLLVGMGVACLRYVLQRPDVVHHAHDGPPPASSAPRHEALRHGRQISYRNDGVGPLYHRRYRVRIVGSELTPEQLLAAIASNVNALSPVEVAEFDAVPGNSGGMAIGDEYVVRMPGPWDAPVTVIERTPSSFRFATLEGHMEAGEIEFRVGRDDDALTFTISSWARSADALFDLLYRRVTLAREMQLYMWAHVCQRAASLSGGAPDGPVQVDTWEAT